MPNPIFTRTIKSGDRSYHADYPATQGDTIISGESYALELLVHNGTGAVVLKSGDKTTFTIEGGYLPEKYEVRPNINIQEMTGGQRRSQPRGVSREIWRLVFQYIDTATKNQFLRWYNDVYGGMVFEFTDIDERTINVRWIGIFSAQRVTNNLWNLTVILEEEI